MWRLDQPGAPVGVSLSAAAVGPALDQGTSIDGSELIQPLVVEGDEGVSVTLVIEVPLWFRAPDGSLIDPRTAGPGGENEGLVKENIKRSIEAFEDNDLDGDEDD